MDTQHNGWFAPLRMTQIGPVRPATYRTTLMIWLLKPDSLLFNETLKGERPRRLRRCRLRRCCRNYLGFAVSRPTSTNSALSRWNSAPSNQESVNTPFPQALRWLGISP